MVPKADSGTFLLLFLLVLSITEPLRPGRGGGGVGGGTRARGLHRSSGLGCASAAGPDPPTPPGLCWKGSGARGAPQVAEARL